MSTGRALNYTTIHENTVNILCGTTTQPITICFLAADRGQTCDATVSVCLCIHCTFSHRMQTETMTDTNIYTVQRVGHQDRHFLGDLPTCQQAAGVVWELAALLVGLLVLTIGLQSLYSHGLGSGYFQWQDRWWHLHCPSICCYVCHPCLIWSSKWFPNCCPACVDKCCKSVNYAWSFLVWTWAQTSLTSLLTSSRAAIKM